jgi:hypothetical protein
MLDLKESCIHPQSGKPYIKSLTGGKDNSIEGKQVCWTRPPLRFSNAKKDGIEYAFVVEFESTADRTYYVKTDPIHQAFKKITENVVEKVIVVDYTVGEFPKPE